MTQPVAPMDGSVSQSGLERTGADVLVRRQRCQIATRQQPEGRGRRQARARVQSGVQSRGGLLGDDVEREEEGGGE